MFNQTIRQLSTDLKNLISLCLFIVIKYFKQLTILTCVFSIIKNDIYWQYRRTTRLECPCGGPVGPLQGHQGQHDAPQGRSALVCFCLYPLKLHEASVVVFCFQSLPQGLQGSVADSAYFVLVNAYLKYFLPSEGSVPPSPFSDSRGSVTAPSPRWVQDLSITCSPAPKASPALWSV